MKIKCKEKKEKAYCWASGLIEFGRRVPKGAIFLRGAPNKIKIRARHGYDGTYLVPGIPESDSDEERLDALQRFQKFLDRAS